MGRFHPAAAVGQAALLLRLSPDRTIVSEGPTAFAALGLFVLASAALLGWLIRFPLATRVHAITSEALEIHKAKGWTRRVRPRHADSLALITGSSEAHQLTEMVNALLLELDRQHYQLGPGMGPTFDHLTSLANKVESLAAERTASQARRREVNVLLLTVLLQVSDSVRRSVRYIHGIQSHSPSVEQVAYLQELYKELRELGEMAEETKAALPPNPTVLPGLPAL